mmetsp:Transcript_40146/g.61715  ORF Transcript_40146/g.61715 Transcript_40146/m.61715 type:complete len:246 (-) Transcript_40146:222-959(-)
MGPDGGDTNRRTRNQSIGMQCHDLTRFPSDFHFLLGVSILLEFVDLGNDVEGKRVGKDVVLDFLAVQVVLRARCEFVHARLSGTARCLVGGHDQTFHTELLDQRPNGHESDGGGTIRVGNQFGFFGLLSVDFGDDERDVFLVTEGGRVVDNDSTIFTLTNILGMFQGKVSIHGQKDDVAFSSLGDVKELHLDITVGGANGSTSTSWRSKNAQLIHRQFAAVFQAFTNFLSNGTGRTHNAYGVVEC